MKLCELSCIKYPRQVYMADFLSENLAELFIESFNTEV